MNSELPNLSMTELRVLGSLIEKSKTTPDYYPMSVNALTAACNQKSSRHPVTNYSEAEVTSALSSLKGQSLVSTAVGGTSRTLKYKHNMQVFWTLSEAEMAVLCLLILRGPLTAGEINSNSGRLHEFSSLQSVFDTIVGLQERMPPMVKEMPRIPGQKETRYIHLLGHVEIVEASLSTTPVQNETAQRMEERLDRLEQELAEVKEKLNRLLEQLQ